MIYRVNKKIADNKFLAHKSLIKEKRGEPPKPFNYNNAIVKKPWGYEYLVFENEFVAIWLLQIIRKRKTSMHCHPQKKTALVLLSGNATHYNLEDKIELNPLDAVMIKEGVFHTTEASTYLSIVPHSEDGIWVMEIESPPLKTDLVRLKDEYGRAETAYEGADSMIFVPKECFKFQMPSSNEVIYKTFFNLLFTIRKGPFHKDRDKPNDKALVSIIGRDHAMETDHSYLRIGELVRFKDFWENTQDADLSGYYILTIEQTNLWFKLSDFVFSFIASLGVKHVFAVCGGGAMHLVDSLGRNENVAYIAMHHEQAAAMSAEAYSRISGKPGAVLVSSGAGTTNTITGLYGAWIDSIPLIFISGQVTTDTMMRNTGLRQFGIEETDIVRMVNPFTKYAVTITDANKIRYHLQKALFLATTGRPGPVWLDIPLDIQSKLIIPGQLSSFSPDELKQKVLSSSLKTQVAKCIKLLCKARRPVLISGYGIRLSQAEKEFQYLVERLKIPLISSWTTSDLIPSNHQRYIGRSGIMGDRAGNFTVQNSDLLLIIGSRMSIPQVGYNYKTFAREAKKIMVDIDISELKKSSLKVDLAINADAKEFIVEMLAQLEKNRITFLKIGDWMRRCRHWKTKYPVVLPEYKEAKVGVNSFYFVDVLSEKLGNGAIVVTDIGTSLISTMQAFKIKPGQRLFSSSGHASMGFGLPGAIGACFASNRKRVICITGDGGLQMNIQELQTIVYHCLPIIIFVLNNGGYLTIKLMQQNHFGRYVGSEKNSGLTFPDTIKIAQAYGIKAERIANRKELDAKIDFILNESGPFICDIVMPENQLLIPRVSSIKKPEGTIVSKPLEDLYPFLSRAEFLENMMIRPVEILTE